MSRRKEIPLWAFALFGLSVGFLAGTPFSFLLIIIAVYWAFRDDES